MYIFWFLHQTTTLWTFLFFVCCCISFDSYIKPQLYQLCYCWFSVVYLLIPTSNHNSVFHVDSLNPLYIFWFLHQTTTLVVTRVFNAVLYIFWFLHQTTTIEICLRQMRQLYIFWFLHQTTTEKDYEKLSKCCISFDSYIKPQLSAPLLGLCNVVYLLIPTSNHNLLIVR